MKGKHLFIMALIMALAGVVLILLCYTSLASVKNVITAAGIIFILAGLGNMVFFLRPRTEDGKPKAGAMGTAVGWMASIAAIILGLCMLLFQNTFIPMVSLLFAVLLLFTAIFQACLLIFGSRPTRLSPWFLLVPMVLFGAAVFVYLQRPGETHTDRNIMLTTGIALAVFAVFSIWEGLLIAYDNHKRKKSIEATGAAPKDDDHSADN